MLKFTGIEACLKKVYEAYGAYGVSKNHATLQKIKKVP